MEKQIKQFLDEAIEELDNENYLDVKINLEKALESLSEMI